jgi:glycosyltransferase involved in cell wall biosynthesis
MLFSIITPSFRNSEWLKLCIASVADQKGVTLEHIIQDSESDDGTLEWLPKDKRVKPFIEKDHGMYDAVNRGYKRAQGDLLAYINCDEQYLPGALKKVGDYFEQNPTVDVVFGDCIVVNRKGEYICERRALIPQLLHTWSGASLCFLTAATFIRRSVIEQHKLFFNTDYRDLGDKEWALRLVRSGLRMSVLPSFLSVFAETGHNMNLKANALLEAKQFAAMAPFWIRWFSPFILLHFRLRRWRAGHYHCLPYEYPIYTLDCSEHRKTFNASNPTFRWIRPPRED